MRREKPKPLRPIDYPTGGCFYSIIKIMVIGFLLTVTLVELVK